MYLNMFTAYPRFAVSAEPDKNGKTILHCAIKGSTFWGHVYISWYPNSTSKEYWWAYCDRMSYSDSTYYVYCDYVCDTKRIEEPICRVEYGGRKEALTVNGTYNETDHTTDRTPGTVAVNNMIIPLSAMAACVAVTCFIIAIVVLYVRKRRRNAYARFE